MKPHRVDQFLLLLDESKVIIRCYGQINKASLQAESKNPILLPMSHPLVELLIRKIHISGKHSPVQKTLDVA